MDFENFPLEEKASCLWEIKKGFHHAKTDLRLIASKELLEIMDDGVVEQLVNVSLLPGVISPVLAMPDAHWGYGAPIGGVFATDFEGNGTVSPGAVGFDINCGVRLITTNLQEQAVKEKIDELINKIFVVVGAGLGGRSQLMINQQEMEEVCQNGVDWMVKNGFGWPEDKSNCEELGKMPGANPENVSKNAFSRGYRQLGSLGSGNHYLEIQKVEKIFNQSEAERLGIKKSGQVAIMIHCGSRGFGHQIATDYLVAFNQVMSKYGIKVKDRQLACCPLTSKEAQAYLGAMACAVNFAFANRQFLTHQVRKVFEEVFGLGARKMEMNLVYDVCHNVAKREIHQKKKVLIHRKGATRAFAGQPVLIGGSMETKSYLLMGTKKAEEMTFASTCHGAGRTMSRKAAKRQIYGRELQQRMRDRGIYVQTASYAGLAEESGDAYKDVNQVVDAAVKAGISLPVASFVPLGNIKG